MDDIPGLMQEDPELAHGARCRPRPSCPRHHQTVQKVVQHNDRSRKHHDIARRQVDEHGEHEHRRAEHPEQLQNADELDAEREPRKDTHDGQLEDNQQKTSNHQAA